MLARRASAAGSGDALMTGLHELVPLVGVKAACAVLSVPRASLYRKKGLATAPPAELVAKPAPARALAAAEREAVLACLHEERFQNSSRAAVYATLLDEGNYHCLIRAMHRILAAEGDIRERRDQLAHPAYKKPELVATRPNQLWGWDITKLGGRKDGWMVADGGECGTGRTAACRYLRQAGDQARRTENSRGPGLVNDLETGRLPDGRSVPY